MSIENLISIKFYGIIKYKVKEGLKMQVVICKIEACPYRSKNGFCLNRVIQINEQGICNHLTKARWQEKIPDEYKSNYVERTRESVQRIPETRT